MKKEDLSFEEKIKKLESLVKELESGEVNLDDAIDKYTEAMKLAKECNDTLNNIRYDFVRALLNNILIMTSDASGNIITQQSIEEFSIGQKIAFNSLLDKKIIIEVTDF